MPKYKKLTRFPQSFSSVVKSPKASCEVVCSLIGGMFFLVSGLLPVRYGLVCMFVGRMVVVNALVVYAYSYFKKQLQKGVVMSEALEPSKSEKKWNKRVRGIIVVIV